MQLHLDYFLQLYPLNMKLLNNISADELDNLTKWKTRQVGEKGGKGLLARRGKLAVELQQSADAGFEGEGAGFAARGFAHCQA